MVCRQQLDFQPSFSPGSVKACHYLLLVERARSATFDRYARVVVILKINMGKRTKQPSANLGRAKRECQIILKPFGYSSCPPASFQSFEGPAVHKRPPGGQKASLWLSFCCPSDGRPCHSVVRPCHQTARLASCGNCTRRHFSMCCSSAAPRCLRAGISQLKQKERKDRPFWVQSPSSVGEPSWMKEPRHLFEA